MYEYNKQGRDKLLETALGRNPSKHYGWLREITNGRCGVVTDKEKKLFAEIEDTEIKIDTLYEELKLLKIRMKEICNHPIDYVIHESRMTTDTLGNYAGGTDRLICLQCGDTIYFKESRYP
jgi:hypothetical protein